MEKRKEDSTLPTRSVMFIEFSEGSNLVRRVKETLTKLEGIMGCKVKAVERAGSPLARQFPLTRLWGMGSPAVGMIVSPAIRRAKRSILVQEEI